MYTVYYTILHVLKNNNMGKTIYAEQFQHDAIDVETTDFMQQTNCFKSRANN